MITAVDNSGRVKPPAFVPSIIRAMRPYQWAKNLLVFLPPALAHTFAPDKWAHAAWALVALSLCASGTYLVNDVLDIEADRQHPVKKRRPFASGVLSILSGVIASGALFACAACVALVWVPGSFVLVLAGYAVVTLAYSLFLKSLLVVDVIVLASLYGLRLYAGSVSATVELSPWLLAFSLFFFLSLAFIKRYVELLQHVDPREGKVKGRGYEPEDAQVVLGAGLGTGYISVLVFLLYLNNSPQAHALYRHPQWLWAVAPVLTYWITRIWFLARRGKVDGDPVIFAVSDAVTYYCLITVAAIVAVSAL